MSIINETTHEGELQTAIDNNRNGSSTIALTPSRKKPTKKKTAKAAKRTARRKAKKLSKNNGELVKIKFGKVNTNFFFIEGINLADFVVKNKDVNGLSSLDKEHQKDLLNRVHNAFALSTGRFEAIKVGKANAKWSKEDNGYRAFVSMQGKLRRTAFGEEKKAAFDKDKAKFLQSIAEREATL
jgi:hypothetical protein